MIKPFRFLFCLFALIVSFQLIGLEQAFCEDSATEESCQDCATCVLNHFIGFENPQLLPAASLGGFTFIKDPSLNLEEPVFNFFRPPISL